MIQRWGGLGGLESRKWGILIFYSRESWGKWPLELFLWHSNVLDAYKNASTVPENSVSGALPRPKKTEASSLEDEASISI